MPSIIDHVVIVGAGFSGALQAINLLRSEGPGVTLIERRETFGRGVAYSTSSPAHVLNVRAANMSAFPDDPQHFVRWLADRGSSGHASFVNRRDYGDYLADLLENARARAPERLRLVSGTAVELMAGQDGVVVTLDRGEQIQAATAILALGNLPPHDPAGIDASALPVGTYVSDPWTTDLAAGLTQSDTVVVLGTGLTMVDAVLALDVAGAGGRIVALSRRGLLPHRHRDEAPPPRLTERPGGGCAELLHAVRARARDLGWRAAVDQLRPHTQAIWGAASIDEQRRFLRHLRPWWDIHRHRLAPQVAERLDELEATGRLRVEAGRLHACEAVGDALELAWRRRGRDEVDRVTARKVINCTGPQGDVLRTREPLLRLLLAAGQIRADPHRLGIDVNAQAEVIDVNGRPNSRLLALGPMTRGAFWEIVAVPELRRQSWSVARRLSNAHWVEGEGL